MFLIVGSPPLPHKQNPKCLYQQKQTGMIFLSEAEMKLNPQTPSFCSIIVFSPSPSPQPIFLVHIQTCPWNLKQLIPDSDSRKNHDLCFVFSPPQEYRNLQRDLEVDEENILQTPISLGLHLGLEIIDVWIFFVAKKIPCLVNVWKLKNEWKPLKKGIGITWIKLFRKVWKLSLYV